jgi:steroid 5-alpha reductase family enzyme
MPLVSSLAVVTTAAILVWLLSLALRDASIADLFWGPGIGLIGWSNAALTGNWSWRPVLVNVLVTIWALRLALHLFARHRGEDSRYRALRDTWGPRFPLASLWVVFLLQAVLAWIVSWPVQAVHVGPGSAFGPVDALGVSLWLAGLVMESVADAQLARFRRDPRNANGVMDKGLWRYSRHPNYFGDCVAWWGIGVIALGQGTWWTLAGPVVMTVLLVRVSGVALLESTIATRRPAYREYIRTTSAFVPWPPRTTTRS